LPEPSDESLPPTNSLVEIADAKDAKFMIAAAEALRAGETRCELLVLILRKMIKMLADRRIL
jgi:hypothetical protein